MELEMAETTADELKEYARWVELSSAVATKDALFTTVDFALRDVFRRDRFGLSEQRRPRLSRRSPSLLHLSHRPSHRRVLYRARRPRRVTDETSDVP
jgi:hypothetical protein